MAAEKKKWKIKTIIFFALISFFHNFGFAEVTFTRQKRKTHFFFVLSSFIRNFALSKD